MKADPLCRFVVDGAGNNTCMDVSELIVELFSRVPPLVESAVDGLDQEGLAFRPDPDANSIGWLTWHLTRVQDHHVADAFDTGQLYVADGWAERFGLSADPADLGYGHSSEEVAAVAPDGPDVIVGYHRATHDRTLQLVGTLTTGDLDRIVDRRWDPPVSLGVRLVSVADDSLQHVGQASYVRGLLDRR